MFNSSKSDIELTQTVIAQWSKAQVSNIVIVSDQIQVFLHTL